MDFEDADDESQIQDSEVARNIRRILGEKDVEYLPHSVTLNEDIK